MKYGTEEWYLYHNIKNEEPVIPLILVTLFLFICKGGILGAIVLWIAYFVWASYNNEKLNHDPEIIIKRIAYNQARENRDEFVAKIKQAQYEEQLRKIEKIKNEK